MWNFSCIFLLIWFYVLVDSLWHIYRTWKVGRSNCTVFLCIVVVGHWRIKFVYLLWSVKHSSIFSFLTKLRLFNECFLLTCLHFYPGGSHLRISIWVAFYANRFAKFSNFNSQRKSNKMQHCTKILFHIYVKLNMFWATNRPSSGA